MNSEDISSTVFSVCIIGSGPAGIITALEYSRLNVNKKVLLVEYGFNGQTEKNALDDSIEITNPINHHDPYECTNKGLGGTSATWGGRCVMYDEVDFIDRPIVANGCTWDTDLFKELDQFLPRTAEYFECGRPVFDMNKIENKSHARIAEGFVEGEITDSVLERWSMPTRFGARYADEIAAQPNLSYIDANEARDFVAPDANGKVSALKIRNVNTGQITEIKADNFVLAAGAQETTRILLRNPQLFANIGGPPTALGKYYQSHVSGKIASVKFYGDPKKTDYGFQQESDGTFIRRRFQFSSNFLKAKNLLNTAIWLDNPLYYNPAHRSGAMSFMYLAMITPVIGKKLAPPAIAHSITNGKVANVDKHIWNIIKGLPGSLITPASIFYKRYMLKRKLPGVFLFSPENTYALHFHAEQVPFERNRMELGSDNEKLIIHYDLVDDDVNSVIKLHEELDNWLRKCNCGELIYWYPKNELPAAIRRISQDGIHQSGTTRIADSAADGVVDRDTKLWGTDNVYVCSSSVFPTSGQANPTFFLGAFAVRLAKHLTDINEKN